MSFPRYERYKDSGVEWLEEVPEGWELKRLGYFFNERREKVSDKDYEEKRSLSVFRTHVWCINCQARFWGDELVQIDFRNEFEWFV